MYVCTLHSSVMLRYCLILSPSVVSPCALTVCVCVCVCVCRFETEVNRWSDSGHDIIIIAKEMCHMMLDMSDFTRCAQGTPHILIHIQPHVHNTSN